MGLCSVADTGAIQQRSMANSCQKGWNGSTGNHKVTQDLTTKSTHGTRQLKRCCFHRIAEGSRPREVWADTSATARRYLGEWTNGKDQFCCTDPKFFLVHELSSQQFKAGLSSKKKHANQLANFSVAFFICVRASLPALLFFRALVSKPGLY